jgi:hypothetical protein
MRERLYPTMYTSCGSYPTFSDCLPDFAAKALVRVQFKSDLWVGGA